LSELHHQFGQGGLGSTGNAFSYINLGYRPYLDRGLRAAVLAGAGGGRTVDKIGTGWAFPNVHVDDETDERNVPEESFGIVVNLGSDGRELSKKMGGMK
jgi:hypothetical protein